MCGALGIPERYTTLMRTHPFLLFAVSGFLFGLPFVFSWMYWSFVPAFVLLLFGTASTASYRKLFLGGVLSGSLLHAGAFFWVWSSIPIPWMESSPLWAQGAAILSYWVLTSVVLGLCTGLFVLIAKKCIASPILLFAAVPFLWVAAEVCKSFLFSVYTFGPGSFLNVGLSYGYLGYLLAEVPLLLQASALAGVYGLSYIAALLGVCVYTFFSFSVPYKKTAALFLCIAGIVLAYVPFVPGNTREPIGKNVIVVEGWFRSVPHDEKQAAVREAMSAALAYDPDYVLMPEDMRFGDSFGSVDEFWEWMDVQTQKKDVVLVDNGPARDVRDVQVLRTYIYHKETHSTYFFDKRYLVPQGEFISYVHRVLLSLFMPKEKVESITNYARFEPGVINDSSAYPEDAPGVLFCFETMVPFAVKRAEHFRNPPFIAHPISHGWFTNPFSLETELAQMLKVSAVWNAVPIVSAGSMTQSRAFLETGTIDEGELLLETEHYKLRRFSL